MYECQGKGKKLHDSEKFEPPFVEVMHAHAYAGELYAHKVLAKNLKT